MLTRSGRTFSVGETSAPMDPNLKDTLNTLIVWMDQMNQRLQEFRDYANANCTDLATRLQRLETIGRRTTEDGSRNDSRSPRLQYT